MDKSTELAVRVKVLSISETKNCKLNILQRSFTVLAFEVLVEHLRVVCTDTIAMCRNNQDNVLLLSELFFFEVL